MSWREGIGQLNGTGDRRWVFLSRGLFVCLGLIILATFLDYGLTYDEEVARWYGRMILRWYSTFFKDQSSLGYYDLYLYGGFFEAISQLVVSICRKILPVDVYETRHLVNALFGFLAVCGTCNLGKHLSGAAAGFFAALFLTMTPGFYGHIFNNSKDVPFAALFAFALYYMLRTYDELPGISCWRALQVGITIGLAMGIRVGGVILLGYLALFWSGWLCSQWIRGLRDGRQLLLTGMKLARTFVLILIAAWTVMLVWWPWAQISPLAHPYAAMKTTAHFVWPNTVLFNGRFLAGTALPWTYLPTWLVISLPEFYFVVLLLGCLAATQRLPRLDKEPSQPELVLKLGLLLFAVAFPILTALILHSTMYDGMRQFLFIVPSLAALCGVSLISFLRSRINRLVKIGAGILILLSLSLTILDMVQLHLYEYVYFNRLFAGGLKSAAERFETDYWGSSYKEGIEWVIKNYRPDSASPIRIANCEQGFIIRHFFEKTEDLRRRFVVVHPSASPNIYLAITRWQCQKMIEGKLIHMVQRQETPLLYIFEVQGP